MFPGWAQELGMREAASLLKGTLAEEKKADKLLSQLAEGETEPRGRLAINLYRDGSSQNSGKRERFNGTLL